MLSREVESSLDESCWPVHEQEASLGRILFFTIAEGTPLRRWQGRLCECGKGGFASVAKEALRVWQGNLCECGKGVPYGTRKKILFSRDLGYRPRGDEFDAAVHVFSSEVRDRCFYGELGKTTIFKIR